MNGLFHVLMNEAGDGDGGAGNGDPGGAGDGASGEPGAPGGSLVNAVNEGGDGPTGGDGAGDGADGKPASDGTGDPSFRWSDDVAGEGEAPEWLLSDKYKTVAEQAKAYSEVAKKLGAFEGAPENYELNLPEGFEGAWDDQNPLLGKFQEIAKEMGMNQKGFDQMAALAVEFMSVDNEIDQQVELAALGENAAKRIKTLDAYSQANMPKEIREDFLAITSTAAGIRLAEWMASRDRQSPLPRLDGSTAPAGKTRADLEKMMEDPRYGVDPAYSASVSKAYEEVYGTDPEKKVVG